MWKQIAAGEVWKACRPKVYFLPRLHGESKGESVCKCLGNDPSTPQDRKPSSKRRAAQSTTPHRGKAGFQSAKLQGLSMVSQMWSAKDQRIWGSYRKEGESLANKGLLCRCLFYILQFLLNLDSASTPLKMVNISDCTERDFEVKQNVFNLLESKFPHLCNAGLL